MASLFRILLLACLTSAALKAEEIIPGIVSYDLPDFFTPSGATPIPAEVPVGHRASITAYLAADNRPAVNHRQVNFSVHITHSSDAEIPGILKARAGVQVAPKAARVGGQNGWRIDHDRDEPSFREGAVSRNATIWVRIRPDRILEVNLTAVGVELFPSLEQTLSGLRITPELTVPPPQAPKAATGTPRLGMERAAVWATCGPPLRKDHTSDIFDDGEYLLYADYSMPLLANLSFHKVSDRDAFLEAMEVLDTEKVVKTLLPLSREELLKLLEKYAVAADGKPSPWKNVGENGWLREDGATARYHAAAKIFMLSRPERH
ncbi:MAG: hypothetical protein EOP87_22435 [Verrucomicrobiaceae bacterium]|nr:MAG: hypothetical protein EOP87_22435 [Verrucomicrobiaceae bacterium]